MSLYCNKSEAARFFGMCRQTMYGVVDGIQKEINAGRYSQYAIAGGKVSKAVVLDYLRYRHLLTNINTRKLVPPYDENAAIRAVGEMGAGK